MFDTIKYIIVKPAYLHGGYFCCGLGLWAGRPDERKGPPHDQDLPGSAPFVSDLNLASEQQKCLDSKILPVQLSTKRHNLNMTEAIEELLVGIKL